jgi:hypothetical protein
MFEKIGFLLLALLLVLVGWLAYAVCQDAKEWPSYRDANHCVRTGEWRSETILTPVIAGKTIVTVLSTVVKREWQCDTGVVWRKS